MGRDEVFLLLRATIDGGTQRPPEPAPGSCGEALEARCCPMALEEMAFEELDTRMAAPGGLGPRAVPAKDEENEEAETGPEAV